MLDGECSASEVILFVCLAAYNSSLGDDSTLIECESVMLLA
jgi:hypothetical protein